MRPAYIAIDFGGGSGRVIAATLTDGHLVLEEIHRFPNIQRRLGGHTYWDFLALFDEMVIGLRKSVEAGFRIQSIGIDTWGVDFGLIDSDGNLLSNPICYRDSAIDGNAKEFTTEILDSKSLYSQAGIQEMDINSLFRLVKMQKDAPALMNAAWRVLFMPDLFSYFLTGSANNEYTIATTSELIDAQTRDWNRELIRRSGLKESLFGPIVQPGDIRGYVSEEICHRIGADYKIPVIAVGSHDTASAVYSVNGSFEQDGTAYLSSGTWSLLGVSLKSPILSEEARLGGFTNEGGVGGTIRFLQNITGLWILQCLIAKWKEEGKRVDYDWILSEAENAQIDSIIDVDSHEFSAPLDMEKAIIDFCLQNNLQVPQTQGEIVRCVLQSLADRYRKGVEAMNELLPRNIAKLQIIGGGSRNNLLNRLTAQATGLQVIAGPVEATGIGNILCQAGLHPSEVKSITEK